MSRDVKVLPALPKDGGLLLKAVAGLAKRPGAVASMPDRTFMVMDHAVDVSRLAAYARVTGYAVRDAMPATWLHVLTFPLQMAMMAADDFPFPLAGLVHVSNEMTLLRPVAVGERLRVSVRAEGLRSHAKGAVFDMRGEVHVGDDLVWSGSSAYLAGGAKVAGEVVPGLRLEAPQVAPSQQWRLGPDLGRRYAAVSGDSNPIHLSPLTARLFGFPRPIIHGMWTHARSVAALGGQIPEAYTVRVQFAKPILLPGKVSFAAVRDEAGWRFAVVNGEGKPHLVGDLS
ncbi:MaoC family dehydratase [Tessaracoccus sp. Z1128]